MEAGLVHLMKIGLRTSAGCVHKTHSCLHAVFLILLPSHLPFHVFLHKRSETALEHGQLATTLGLRNSTQLPVHLRECYHTCFFSWSQRWIDDLTYGLDRVYLQCRAC